MNSGSQKTVVLTGAAGFIGFHTAKRLLENGWKVFGIDNFSTYYDPAIKEKRVQILSTFPAFTLHRQSIAEFEPVQKIVADAKPALIIHLAAQAGVRYSLKNPWAYADANYLGTLNIFEAARKAGVTKVIYASSSSVYGSNTKMPFSESDRTDTPLSLYAASKKANEVLAYSYHHLYDMDMIGLRFFTVYGEYGRPDLALFKFVKNILLGKEITLYNRGEMTRNFTHVNDIVAGIAGLIEKGIGGYEIYNLGGAEATPLKRFVELIEKSLGKKATVKLMPLQEGDVPATIADTSKAHTDFGFEPKVTIEEGIDEFATWFMKEQSWLVQLAEPEQ